MRRAIAAATFAACLAAGVVAGAALGAPALSGAAETVAGTTGWVQEALSGLVDDDTITQEQADAVEAALQEARPDHGGGHRGFGGRVALSTIAEQLGMDEDDLRAELHGGATVAEVAAAQDVDVQDVVEAVVNAQRERLAERVAAGDLTQQRADDALATLEERITAFVNGDHPAWRGGGHHGRGGPGMYGGGPPEDEPADDAG